MIMQLPNAEVPVTVESRFALEGTQDAAEFARLPYEAREKVLKLINAMRILASAPKKRKAAKQLAAEFQGQRGFNEESLIQKYYAFLRSGKDWRSLIDKSLAGPEHYGAPAELLPPEFVKFWKGFGCSNDKSFRAQVTELHRLWRAGESIKGYGTWKDYFKRIYPDLALPRVCPMKFLPEGWSERNLYRKLPPKVHSELARKGVNAARKYLPHVKVSRAGLRPLEIVEFDDLRTDYKIWVKGLGICELWLLRAQCVATGICLIYGMRPVPTDSQGSHLTLADMKFLVGALIQKYGLPPYKMTWKLERGTATLGPEMEQLLQGLLGDDRIEFSYTSMIGGKVLTHGDKPVGNAQGKGRLEVTNYLAHTTGGALPGQIGSSYGLRPASYQAKEIECRELFKAATEINPDLFSKLLLPVMTEPQARLALDKIFAIINTRRNHKMEDFEDLLFFRTSPSEEYLPIALMPADCQSQDVICMKESAVERWVRLSDGLKFEPVRSEILTWFYDHAPKPVWVGQDGQITFEHQKKSFTFKPNIPLEIAPGTGLLALFHPVEVDSIHLISLPPKAAYVATWSRYKVGTHADPETIRENMRYTALARKATIEQVQEFSSDIIDADNARREHNRQVLLDGAMIATGPDALQGTESAPTSVAAALEAIKAAKAATLADLKAKDEAARARRRKLTSEAREEILSGDAGSSQPPAHEQRSRGGSISELL